MPESSEGYLTEIGKSVLYHESWDTPQKSWVSNFHSELEGGVVRGLQILIINNVVKCRTQQAFPYNFAGDT